MTKPITDAEIEATTPEYVEAICRNEQDAVRSHLYRRDLDGLWPMCGYGWNRLNGERYSIFRGHRSARGTCKICQRRADQNLDPFKDGWPHKTKWI